MSTPPGQMTNFVDQSGQSWLWIFTVVVCLTVCTLMVWIRLYVGRAVTRDFRCDDWLVFVSWLLFIAHSAIGIEFTKHGAFVDIWNVSPQDLRTWRHLNFFGELVYTINICLIKLSVLILYRRIFVPLARRNRVYWTIMTVIAFNVMFYIASTLVLIFVCTPIKRAWDPEIPGTCVNVRAVILAVGALNVASDFFILAIPITVVRGLRIPRKRKMELFFLFAAGLICFGSSVVRMVYSGLNISSNNETVVLTKVALWSFAETTSCFLASCIPMVPRLKRHIQSLIQKRKSKNLHTYPPPQTTYVLPRRDVKPARWSITSSTVDIKEDQEDPYLLQIDGDDASRSSSVEEAALSAIAEDNKITVSKSWHIKSVPEVHTKPE